MIPVGSHRLVVFTSQLSYSVLKGIVEIDQGLGNLEWLILIHKPGRSPRNLLRSQWLNLKRNGWRWIPFQISEIVGRLGSGFTSPRQRSAQRWPGAEYDQDAVAARPNVRVVTTPDIHAEESLALVRDFGADLGLSLAAPILRRALFSLPRLGTINLHKGRLPDFRGMPPAFWELSLGEQEVGCSVHWVDEKLDNGAVVGSTTVRRQKHSTLRGLQIELDEVGVTLVLEAVQRILADEAESTPQSGPARTFRKPTLKQQAALSRQLLASRPVPAPPARRWASEAFSILMHLTWYVGLRAVLAPRITVMLYHRVSDDARDNLTVGIEQFDSQMAIVATRCQPVSLGEVIAGKPIPRSRKPLVAVTFDDGYLDNYQFAAPILQRHGLPAAFFVATEIVQTGRPFPHDLSRGNVGMSNMGWDHLRRMHSSGFDVGSHTANHIDCAGEDEAVVRHELKKSLEDLRRELPLGDVVLAYPYGGRQHMTPARLELVRQAGYAACMSAYGGTNIGRVDRFNVKRRAINWEFSDRAFLRACLGLM